MILIVAPQQDAHAQAVRTKLAEQTDDIIELDLAQFPQQAQVALNFMSDAGQHESVVSNYERELDLTTCTVVWWRQPRSFVLHPELTDQVYRSFAYTECQAALTGLWLALDAQWINHPLRCETAVRKPLQLKLAQAVGLPIPATLITNNPIRARAFVQTHGIERTRYQAFSANTQRWHEARLLQPQQLALLDNVCYAPVLFQEDIPAKADLWVVAVGETMFAQLVPMNQPTSENPLSSGMAYTLPAGLANQLHTLMQQLGLVYGLLHLRLTPKGEVVFLEVDPTGDWLPFEQQPQQPITAALADLLLTYHVACPLLA